jgi:hypothetical protein
MVAIDVLDRIFGAHAGWNATRDRSIEAYGAELRVVASPVGVRAVGPSKVGHLIGRVRDGQL